MNRELLSSSYDFHLPSELIATEPASPRDSSKLLVYNRKTQEITHSTFNQLNHYLPKETTLIFNDTKVIKARLFGTKKSGGRVELLINRPLDAYAINVFIRGRVKEDMMIDFDKDIRVKILTCNEDGSRNINFFHKENLLRFEELLPFLESIGHIPLPPYIQRDDSDEDSVNYQSVFAKYEGAVAAPTASLHFSDALFDKVTASHKYAYVTLHVGAGTFKPVESEVITNHPMHSEYYNISDEAKAFLDANIDITCVGTTSTRTVEYYARTKESKGEANLFLHPQNRPLLTNHLITNFHLPKSTLLMLVASFIGVDESLRIYDIAIKNRYRFYSYGDAMLIL